MTSDNQRIDFTISFMAHRRMAFSAQDVADYEEWEGPMDSVENALRLHCADEMILRLGDVSSRITPSPRYLGKRVAIDWWIRSTLRWANADFDYVKSPQLARAMALAFDSCRWNVPPAGLLDVGLEYAMVANGCTPGTFVFPWASLLRSDPRFTKVFHDIFTDRFPTSWRDKSLAGSIEQALSLLPDREAAVLRLRFGLRDGRRRTLEEIGREFGVTRERIRQIQVKTLRKLRRREPRNLYGLGFAADFVRSGGSLIILQSERTVDHSLLFEAWDIPFRHLEELGISVITTRDLSQYRDSLYDDDGHALRINTEFLSSTMPFLSESDANRIQAAEDDYWKQRVKEKWTRSRMLREALRTLGRAAHFQEIAGVCNRLFPDNQSTAHNWHAALDRTEHLGIVWIGRKGMYGLKEHGYSKPDKDLFESVAYIVEVEYSRTNRPVPDQVVIAELSKLRRELNRNSVIMALGFNDRVEQVSPGRYAPKDSGSKHPTPTSPPHYDLSVAFAAFSAHEDADP